MNLVERVKNILLAPTKEWEVIKGESTSVGELFSKYAVILAAIPAVAGFIGYSLIGVSVMGVGFRLPIGRSIIWAALQYGIGLVALYILAVIIDALAPSFGAAKNMTDSLKVAVYSMTASWVGGVFMLIPSLYPLYLLAGVYSLVLLYFGIKTVKAPPPEKAVGYFVVSILLAIVLFGVVGAIVSRVVFGTAMMGGMAGI
jgi:hypothetical protein